AMFAACGTGDRVYFVERSTREVIYEVDCFVVTTRGNPAYTIGGLSFACRRHRRAACTPPASQRPPQLAAKCEPLHRANAPFDTGSATTASSILWEGLVYQVVPDRLLRLLPRLLCCNFDTVFKQNDFRHKFAIGSRIR